VHKPAKFRTAQAPIIVHGTDHFILNHLQLQCKHCVTQRTCHAKRFILDLATMFRVHWIPKRGVRDDYLISFSFSFSRLRKRPNCGQIPSPTLKLL
jgi:hypothetical protein